MNMSTVPETPAETAARLADQHGSEFNHHVAGFFLILAGIIVLLEDPLGKSWPLVRYVWPMCFLLGGLLLLIFSDPEVWPVGAQSWWYTFNGHNTGSCSSTFKAFSLILLVLRGTSNFERARGRMTSLCGLVSFSRPWLLRARSCCCSMFMEAAWRHPAPCSAWTAYPGHSIDGSPSPGSESR